MCRREKCYTQGVTDLLNTLYSITSDCNELVAVQARAKRKVVKLVLVVITTFVVCWSPHQVTRQSVCSTPSVM